MKEILYDGACGIIGFIPAGILEFLGVKNAGQYPALVGLITIIVVIAITLILKSTKR